MLKFILIAGLLVVSVAFVLIIALISKKKKGLSADAAFVKQMLPAIDCGMCGQVDCANFAKKVAEGKLEPEACKLIKPENAQNIKKYFKPTYNQSTKLVALVKCKGGCRSLDKYVYDGTKSCSLQESLHSGAKACKYACLGCGDCAKACKYNAIKINERGVAEIIRSRCTGCGACVDACPNSLIEMTHLTQGVNVICNNQNSDPSIVNKCDVGCIHCGGCIKVCPVNAISVKDNIPVIDKDKCIECHKCIAECPTHVISRTN